jgi:hypothetical protein
VAITIPTRERTVAPITGAMVTIIQRLTMTPPRELMGGNRLLMGLTGRRHAAPVTILTPALMPEVHRSRHLMGVEAQRKRITRTQALMLRRDRVRARTLNGVVPTCREETRALRWAITQQRMVR